MTKEEKYKWQLIDKISKQGNKHGNNGGIADLLEKYDKLNTQEITIEECEEFLRLNEEV